MGWGIFNKEEKQRLQNQNLRNDGSGDRFDVLNEAEKVELENLLKEQEYNFWRENMESSEASAIADEEYGYDYTPESSTSSTNNSSQNKDKTTTKTRRPYRNPLRKIANGGVLQYPIDLDTDLQDYFEIQIFRYRAAGGLPGIKQGNQGYEKDKVKKFEKVNNSFETGGYLSASNRRGNRQNFRLQDLQSTIQLPIPPSLKDMNSVDFTGGTMSGLAAAMFGPTVQAFLGKKSTAEEAFRNTRKGVIQNFRDKATAVLGDIVGVGGKTLENLGDAIDDKGFRRVTSLNAIAQAIGALGVSVDVEQAITRTSGAVRNPNLELLFKGPSLRSFNFNIRLTPRSPEE